MVATALGTIGRERRGPKGTVEKVLIASIARIGRLLGGGEPRRREAQLA